MAENVLQVTERILQEASSAQPVLIRSISQEVGGGRDGGKREEGEKGKERREEGREVGRERRRERKRGKRIRLESMEVHSRGGARVRVRKCSATLNCFVFIKVVSNSFRFSQGAPMEEEEESNKLQVLLKHIESPFVQSNPAVREGLMHIIPFLTFGDPKNMNILLQHFAPYLNFEK